MATARWNLIWMSVLVAVNQIGFGAVVPALPLYARSFGVSVSAIGLAVGVYGLARFVGSPPAGWISDRFGRKWALALGGLVTSGGNLWCALAGSYPEFILARFVAGTGAGLIVTTGQIVLADISTPERRGRMLAVYQGVFIFAAGFGPLPGGLISEHFGLNAPFYAYAVAGILAGLVAWFAVAETRDPAHAALRARVAGGLSFTEQARRLSRNLGFVLACFVSLANAVARTGGLFSVVPLLGTIRLGLSVDAIGFALAAGTVLGLLAAYPGGMLVDHFGRKAVIAPSTVISGAAMLIFCVAPDYLWFIVASVAWGTASSIGGAAPAAYAADTAPPGLNATTVTVFRMAGDVGYVAGPIALGLISDGLGAVAALLIAAGLLLLSGVLFAALAPETHRNKR